MCRCQSGRAVLNATPPRLDSTDAVQCCRSVQICLLELFILFPFPVQLPQSPIIVLDRDRSVSYHRTTSSN